MKNQPCSPETCCVALTPNGAAGATEVIDAVESDLGGYKDVSLAVKAKGVPEPGEAPFARLKFEGGVHRVQRVPVTESPGPDSHIGGGRARLAGSRGR